MLVQSLFLIATMLVLAGAILTSTLVSARTILHQTMVTKSQTAMNDAMADFVTSTQSSVQKYGSQAKSWPAPAPTVETLCPSKPVSGCPIATIGWAVTGVSDLVPAKTATSADATYLATTVNEQRISATISVKISNPGGTDVYAERSREVTARVFDAAPWVIITGSRDVGSEGGNYHAGEGDTGGAVEGLGLGIAVAPDLAQPAQFTDTRILTSIDCKNSTNSNKAIGKAYHDPNFHPYGNLSFSFESSCGSGTTATQNVPSGYVAPSGSLFVAQPADPDEPWNKGDEDKAAFPR